MDLLVLVGSLLTIAAIISTRLAQRFGVPALVLFVIIGVLAGSSGPGGIVFADYRLSLDVGLIALAVILLSGGLDTQARLFRASLVPAGLLATFGVLIKMLIVGVAAWALTPLDFVGGLLLGAVLAPTDAAAVFSVLKGRGLPARLRGILETESGTNDPVSIYLTLTLSTFLITGQASTGDLVVGVITQLVLGALLGYLSGRLLVTLVNRVSVDSFGLYPVLVLAGGLCTYAATNLLGGNGFLAIYLVGLVLGNHPLAHRQNIGYFMDGAAWGGQIAMFLLLGLLVFPDQLVQHLPVALLMTAILMFVARPISVYLTLTPLYYLTGHFYYSFKEQTLLSWAGLKGAVPIILAIIPLLDRVPNGELIFNIVFVVVILGATVQGSTVVPLARSFGMTKKEPPVPPLRVELGGAAPTGTAIYDVYLEEDRELIGKRLADLNLPDHIVVVGVYRGDRVIAPRGNLTFEPDDHVFILNSKSDTVGIPPVFSGRKKARAPQPEPTPKQASG